MSQAVRFSALPRVFIFVAMLLVLLAPETGWTTRALAQKPDDYVDDVTRFITSTTRHSRGKRGEDNIAPVLRRIGYTIEARYPEHKVLDHGIDAIYRDLKTLRFNIVEAKATTEQGKLYLGLLQVRKSGERQMDDIWIRKKLKEAALDAKNILDNPTVDLTSRAQARHTLQLIDEIARRRYGRYEKTLVVTRLLGVDSKLKPSERIAADILAEFTHVIEVSRNGRVLMVHK